MKITRIRFPHVTFVLVGVVATLLIFVNDTRNAANPVLPARTAENIPGSAALRATLNPETGRPDIGSSARTLALDPDTREALRRDNEGLVEVRHPNGAVSVVLQGRFQHASMARIDRDGKVFICAGDTSMVHALANARSRKAEVK